MEKSEYFIYGLSIYENTALCTEKEMFEMLKDLLNDPTLYKKYRPFIQMRFDELSPKYDS